MAAKLRRTIAVYSNPWSQEAKAISVKSVIIFLDLFFATTTIVTLLSRQLKSVILSQNNLESFTCLAKEFPVALLATEPSIFSRNRSSLEGLNRQIITPATPMYVSKFLNGQSNCLVLWSTNGTPGLLLFSGRESVFVGCAGNQQFLSEHISESIVDRDIAIVCAGSRAGVSIEDLWCAGGFVSEFCRRIKSDYFLDTSAEKALDIFKGLSFDNLVKLSPVALLAQARGQLDEVYFSLQRNNINVAPFLSGKRVILGGGN